MADYYLSSFSDTKIEALLESVDYPNLTEKATPADADMMLLQDNAAGGAPKKWSILNIKAFITNLLLSLGWSRKNLLHNADFSINQRGVSGTVTLGAGVGGHDRWKAGASGCTYTFATSNGVTTLTITAGSLIQVIEGANLDSGTYCLSWGGTAQGKIGGGSYSTSGVTASVTGGTNLNIEFNSGTLSRPYLEKGTVSTRANATPSDIGEQMALCERFLLNPFSTEAPNDSAQVFIGTGFASSATSALIQLPLPVTLRTNGLAPTVTLAATHYVYLYDGTNVFAVTAITNRPGAFASGGAVTLTVTSSGLTAGKPLTLYTDHLLTAKSQLLISKEL